MGHKVFFQKKKKDILLSSECASSTIANTFILLTTQLTFNFSLRAGIILAGVKFNMATVWKILEIPGGPTNLRKQKKQEKKQKNSSFETL